MSQQVKQKPFTIPVGKLVHHCRLKLKHPRVVDFHIEGREIMGTLSCGHIVKLYRVPLRDSSDYENRLMLETWHESGLAKHDAIIEVVKLNETIKQLKYALLDASDELSKVWKSMGQINPNSHAQAAEQLADSVTHL